MFENFTKAKPRRRGLRLLAIGSALLHVGVGAMLIILGLWQVEELGRPNRGLAMATGLPASPPAGSEAKAAPEKVKAKQKIVKDARQPNPDRKADPSRASEASENTTGEAEGEGEGEGEGPGVGPGGPGLPGLELCLDPDRCQAMAALPKADEEPKQPAFLPPTVLSELRRTAGDPQVQPPSSTKNAMSRNNESRIVAVVRMCLDTSGGVSGQSIVKSSGHDDYDGKLLNAIRKWRYEPYRANGMPVAICTHLTFIYEQE